MRRRMLKSKIEGKQVPFCPLNQADREEPCQADYLYKLGSHFFWLQILPSKIWQGEELLASFQDLRRGGTLSGRS
jgi:hypothetical protein